MEDKIKLELAKILNSYSFRDTLEIAKEIKEISNARKIFAILDEALSKVPSSNVFDFISELQRELFSNVKRFDEDKVSIEAIIKEFYDRQELYKEKFKNGGKIIQPKMPAGEYGFSCLIQDSEGNIVGFYSSK
jgi:hypothetical protein